MGISCSAIDTNNNCENKDINPIIENENLNLEEAKIFWIDPEVDSKENSLYKNKLENYKIFQNYPFKEIDKSIKKIKSIKFDKTFIIISGKLYIKFIQAFKDQLKKISIIPKIIVFTGNKKDFYENNRDFLDIIGHPFYNFGGIKYLFKEINNFLLENSKKDDDIKKKENKNNLNETQISNLSKDYESKLIFEYLDCKEKLVLPLFYKTLIEIVENDKIEQFSKELYNKYKDKKNLKNLLSSIININKIPIELLSKYFSRMYTDSKSRFYYHLNNDLREGQSNIYLPYIKVLYEGVRLQSLDLASDKILYRGGKLSNEEIKEN